MEPDENAQDRETDAPAAPVQVSPGDLSPDALRGLVESFVHREGTDYGAVEKSLDQKVADVMAQLERGEAEIWFDPETESINLVRAGDGAAR